ncbi:hypothetical protein Tco_1420841 [Tanacetum coccineum]
MTQNSNTKIFTPFANTKRQFRARKDTMPISVHNIYSFYVCKLSNAESEEMGEVDIETLIMEQYLALNSGDIRIGVRKLEIDGNVDFEIKGQFLRELRDNTYPGNENEDAHEHVGRILEIASLFNTPNSTRQAIVKKIREEKGLPRKTPAEKLGTFAEKVKRHIKEEQEKGERLLESLEKEPVNTPLANTIRKMPDYTKCLQELVIEKIKNKEASMDNKVPINVKRPMLATAHARIDIFGRKISLEVGMEKVIFNANEGKTSLSVCVINDFQVPKEFEEPEGLE